MQSIKHYPFEVVVTFDECGRDCVYSYAIVSLSNTAIRESALCEPNGIDGGNPLCLAGWVYGSYRKGTDPT